jgi:hypothetical protein
MLASTASPYNHTDQEYDTHDRNEGDDSTHDKRCSSGPVGGQRIAGFGVDSEFAIAHV